MPQSERTVVDARLAKRLAEIGLMASTVDLTKRASYVSAAGWHVDAREVSLPAEAPGVPETDGPFVIASRIVREYTFPPRSLIFGTFDPSAPLENRAMLLTARFLWLTFELPVRVSRVIDLTRAGRNGDEYAWGYSYQTLDGHLERGEITFEIIKHLASGSITFRIHSFSQTGHIANIIHRIGFRIVGRRLQQRFAEQSLKNMQLLVATEMTGRAVAAAETTARPA
ncbi:MAG TPA: DUF1990 family protein [Gemmatimonadaceae bacterium]|nr:DUF1990 family protein [Gemmatimonadaceae bacterium]